jgi:hypothetical protein
MQFNRLSAFTLGVIITAASVGAVSYANATGNKTLKACANKSTGAMRYISKGSCKKTETSLSWSQMGIQGLPGVAGAKGDTGAAGTNGTNGSNGTNGQNFHVIDATGRDLGIALSSSATTANVMFEGGIWTLQNTGYTESLIDGELNSSSRYIDSSCVSPYWSAPSQFAGLIQAARGAMTVSGTTKYYKPSGAPYLGSTSKFYRRQGAVIDGVRACIEITSSVDSEAVSEHAVTYFTNVVEVTPPLFTAPFTIVAK